MNIKIIVMIIIIIIMFQVHTVNILQRVNKYECRTGPFEGFFVSSVEFCKHVKFDDKDNPKR